MTQNAVNEKWKGGDAFQVNHRVADISMFEKNNS